MDPPWVPPRLTRAERDAQLKYSLDRQARILREARLAATAREAAVESARASRGIESIVRAPAAVGRVSRLSYWEGGVPLMPWRDERLTATRYTLRPARR